MALLLSEEKNPGNGKNTGFTIRLFSLGSYLEARKLPYIKVSWLMGGFPSVFPDFTAQ
jgi:hypothetical protein